MYLSVFLFVSVLVAHVATDGGQMVGGWSTQDVKSKDVQVSFPSHLSNYLLI